MAIEREVTKIVDGDTINVQPLIGGENSVRLLGIDTPETNYYGRSQGQHADDAKVFLNSLVSVGDTIKLEMDQEERDKFGRVLAYVLKGTDNANIELVKAGMAAPYQIYPNLAYFDGIRQATINARDGGKGIFDPDNPLLELPFEFRMRIDRRAPHKYVGNFQTMEYYDPKEYNDVPLEDRVFFFEEQQAIDADYTPRSRPVDVSKIVDKAYEGLAFAELLKAPVSALYGVSKNDGRLLKEAFGIETIEDMAKNKYFKWAQAIYDLARNE